RSSGRSDDGKNCRGMSGSARRAAPKNATVSAIVTHLARIASVRKQRYHRNTRPGSADWPVLGGLRTATPNSGREITATNQETVSAIATTAKSENAYSPAELAAKPTGTKPAIVTNVPASMANA